MRSVRGKDDVRYVVRDSPVVRFDSAPADANGHHSAIMLTPTRGTFPPNTLCASRIEGLGRYVLL